MIVPAAMLVAGAPAAPLLPSSMSVALSTSRPGARPVAVMLTLRYEMQCGYPGPGPVVVRLPAREHIPAALPAGAVLVNGRAATAAVAAGSSLRVALPPRPQVMCDVIGPGRLTIAFGRRAGLGNPGVPGGYTVTARRQSSAFAAHFAIRAG